MNVELQRRFGAAIKKYRLDQKISQEKFALKIGMDRTYYASVENGKRNISLENIDKIAKGLNIAVSQIFIEMEGEQKNV